MRKNTVGHVLILLIRRLGGTRKDIILGSKNSSGKGSYGKNQDEQI